MASNPPRITPIPIPVPGHAPSPQSAPATSATKVLNSTAANRNASPSSVSSAGEDPARKMKRTSAKANVMPGAFLQAPPWAASLLSSKPSTSTSTGPLVPPVPNLAPPTQDHSMVLDSPEPIRIESDILPPNPEGPVKSEFSPEDTPLEDVTPAKPSLSMSSQIQALQQSWQAKSTSADSQGSEEVIRRVSSGDVQPSRPALNWTQALQAKRKQSSGLPGGDSKRRLTENGVGSGSEDTTAQHGSSRKSMPTSTSAEPTSSAKPGFIPIKRQPLSVSSSDDNGMLDDDSTDSDSDSEPDAPVQLDSGNADPPPRPFKMLPTLYGRPENELTTTNDGDRLYCQWKGENTPLEASCGALLPTGYTLHSDPEYPFICPDRVCRSIFRSIQGLGKHFGARHRNTMYNDNLDGTVSATASDSAPASTSSTKPAPVAIVPPNAGQTVPAELLDMEEWEIAPGRVRDDQSQEPTNVAFSNAYLTSNQAVSVSEDIAFNVIVIKPGGSHRWTDEEDKVRICSVAVGKVKVKLDMTDPFQIGPNGMFKLKPGTSCSIENRTYIDAIIHVTSVTLY
ncbi:hypothetical protein CGGC5_v002719 [Colletotrichum fructicola Nara gc5]|uniref:C2H2-type domain-containing protein n=1 Tax=Colletotrichum fructicola (strain Nara gc5) TaxID=1213859 RepID=A0A7J6JFJ3_COLFN|nr:hypothetical protein CGGC5_v002719 [Colletotrichum fructicola Nara gc5]